MSIAPPPVLVPDAFQAERAAVEQLIAGRARIEKVCDGHVAKGRLTQFLQSCLENRFPYEK